MSGGEIKNCYALDSDSGPDLYGGSEDSNDTVGGLVGRQTVCWQYHWQLCNTAMPMGEDAGVTDDDVGGLVGRQTGGSIIARTMLQSDADGGAGHSDRVGGLNGTLRVAVSIGSYATGICRWGRGDW